MKTKKPFAKFLSILLGAGSYACLFLPFLLISTTTNVLNNTINNKEALSYQNWVDLLEADSDKLWAWNTSNIVMILALTFIGVIVFISLIQFFVKSKSLNNISNFICIIEILTSIVFVVFFIIGCVNQSSTTEILGSTITIKNIPHFAPCVLFVGTLLSSILARSSNK